MAAPPQFAPDLDTRAPVAGSRKKPALEPSDPAALPAGPAARILSLQSTHGNFFVQRAIEHYNAKHPLPPLPAPKPAPPSPSTPSPAPAAVPPKPGTPAPKPAKAFASPSAEATKDVTKKPVRPVAVPLSGSAAVSSAIAAPVRAKPPGTAPAAAPALAKGAGPTLNQWKSRVSAAAGKGLVKSAPRAAPEAERKIAGVKAKKSGAKTDFKAEAAKKIPPPPKTDIPAPPTDTLAIEIHNTIAAVSGKRLSDQNLPVLEQSPGYAGITHPAGQFPVIGEPPDVKQEQDPPKDANAGAPPATPDAAAQDEAAKKKKAEDQLDREIFETLVGGTPPPAVTIHDSGPAPRPVIPETAKADIGDSIAMVLSKSQEEAQEMVDLAEKTAYPKDALAAQAPEIAKDAVAPEKTRLDQELHSIGAGAGLEAKELDAKATAVIEQEKQACIVSAEDLESKSSDAETETKKKGAEDRQAIAAAAARNEDEIELKAEAVGTPPDPKVVASREQRLLDSLDEQSSNSRVAYRKALETREKALGKGASDQIVAYRRLAKSEADEIKALYPNDPEKARTEAWPSVSWADREAKKVTEAIAVLTRDARKESGDFQTKVTHKQTESAEKIHDWADKRLSRTRSFWEQIIALITHWRHIARSDTQAWEKARDQGTLDAMAGDLAAIAQIKEIAAKKNVEELKAAVAGLDEEHQILLLNFFKSGGDSIMAVAGALLGRVETRRVPELAEEFRQKSLELTDWEKLNKLAQSINPGFNAEQLANQIRDAVEGAGTDEDELFAALKHHTPLEIKAVRLAYGWFHHDSDGQPRDMDEDIHDDLSGDEDKRAKAALEGDVAGEDVEALHHAITGFWGADKSTIMETLRGKSPIERDELLDRYKSEYGVDLRDHLGLVLNSEAMSQADALLAGDADKADAIALKRAMHSHLFGGADIDELDAVYAQIRKEVEAEAPEKNMTTAEVEAEYKRRAAAVEHNWNAEFGEGKPDAMKEAFKDKLSGGEQDLAIALAEDNHIVEDAARIRMESESFWYTSDKKLLSVFRKQHDRAETEVRRDMMVKFREQAIKEKWTPEEAEKKFKEMNEQAEKDIDAKAQSNLDNLSKRYDEAYPTPWGPHSLDLVVETEMSGNEQEEARLLRKQAGKMTIAQEVYWATKGLGTDNDLLRHALQGKSKAELDEARKEYARDHDGSSLDEDVYGDTSGRDEFDFGQMLKGKPDTPEEEIQRMQEKREYELGPGSGLGSAFASEEVDSLQRTSAKAEQTYDLYKQAVKDHGANSKEAQAALDRFHEWTGYTDDTISALRKQTDSITDHLAMAAAIVVGAIVAIASGGAATPAEAALIAALSAGAGAVTSMTVKVAMKGHAYGIEDYGTDVLLGAVDVAAAALTAGVGNVLLKSNLLSRLAEDQFLTRAVKYGTAHALSGMAAALPTGLLAQAISPETWGSETPLRSFLFGFVKSEAISGGIAVGMGFHEVVKGGGAHEGGAPHEQARETALRPEEKAPISDTAAAARQIAKSHPPDDLEAALGTAAKPAEESHALVAKSGKAPPTDPSKGTIYVEPGSPEYHAMLHEGWTDAMLRSGLAPFEPPQTVTGPELPPGNFKTGMQTPDQAYAAYNEAIARAPGREVGIFRNLETGEYVVRVGDEVSVDFPEGGVDHEAVLHFHPNPENILTFRNPSIDDIAAALDASEDTGRPVTQFVEHPIPGTTKRARTAITVDGETGRIRVEYEGPKGRVTQEFPDLDAYETEYNSRKIAPTGKALEDIRANADKWLAEQRGETPPAGDEEQSLGMARKRRRASSGKARKPKAPPAGEPSKPVGVNDKTGGLEIELTRRRAERLAAAERAKKWTDLPGNVRTSLGKRYNDIIQKLVRKIASGGRARVLHYAKVDKALIDELREIGGRVLMTEGRLKGGSMRFDIAEIDFNRKTVELIDLTAMYDPDHAAATKAYAKELSRLTGFQVKAIEMPYVGADEKLLDELGEFLLR